MILIVHHAAIKKSCCYAMDTVKTAYMHKCFMQMPQDTIKILTYIIQQHKKKQVSMCLEVISFNSIL